MRYLLSIYFMLSIASLQAQVHWSAVKLNLGMGDEQQELMLGDFYLRNFSTDTVHIKTIQTDCDCTATKWPFGPILPGDSAHVQLAYHSLGNPGSFEKQALVHLSDGSQQQLQISGQVLPKREYASKTVQGAMTKNAFFSYRHIYNLGTIERNSIHQQLIPIEVRTKDSVHFLLEKAHLPSAIRLRMDSSFVGHNGKKQLILQLRPNALAELGFNDWSVAIPALIADKTEWIDLRVMASIVPNQTDLHPRGDHQPVVVLDFKEIDLGRISKQHPSDFDLLIENTGSAPLSVFKIQSSCSCLQFAEVPAVLPAGSAATLKLTFDPKGRRGPELKRLYIFTNDPENPVSILTVKAIVKSE
jgi:hypothetical protein